MPLLCAGGDTKGASVWGEEGVFSVKGERPEGPGAGNSWYCEGQGEALWPHRSLLPSEPLTVSLPCSKTFSDCPLGLVYSPYLAL